MNHVVTTVYSHKSCHLICFVQGGEDIYNYYYMTPPTPTTPLAHNLSGY